MSYVDLHLHLLPGADDGARDERESIRFAQRLVREGTGEVTVTPHVGVPMGIDPDEVAGRTERLQAALDAEGVPLRLHPGGELHPGGARDLDRGELELIAHGPAGRRWLLMEVPFTGIDEHWVETVAHLRDLGFAVLVAHPERAAGFLRTGLALLEGPLEHGARLQVNTCSLLGRQGPEAQRGAEHLLRTGLAHVLATDAHPGSREHTLRDAHRAARALGLPEARCRALLAERPRALLRSGIAAATTGIAA